MLENFPESEGLVCCGAGHCSAVGVDRQVQDPARVTAEVCDFFHLGVLPDAELVVHEPMRGQDLLVIRVPY